MKKTLFRIIKIFFRVVECAVIAAILLYVFMFKSTDPVVEYIEDAVKGNIPYEEVVQPVQSFAFHFSERYKDYDIGEIYVDAERSFVLHNWNEGYIWILVDRRVKDVNGQGLTSGEDPALLKIRRINGEWVVVDSKHSVKGWPSIAVPW